jgi:hypothetical protein
VLTDGVGTGGGGAVVAPVVRVTVSRASVLAWWWLRKAAVAAVVPWEAIVAVLGEEAAVEELSQAAVSGRHGTVDGQGLGRRGD